MRTPAPGTSGSAVHTPPAHVRVHSLTRTFTEHGNPHTVLRDVDLDIPAGRTVALLGPSGCGKSTLLRQLAGLDHPTDGRVSIDGDEVRGADPRCAVVFQEPRLLPWRTLAGNVALGLPRTATAGANAITTAGAARRANAAARAQAHRLLETVGLGSFARHRPHQISGGMAQRVALARALARRPGVLLLDEPLASLDALTRMRMQDLVEEVTRSSGTTVLLVTHDVDEALHLADRVVLLGRNDDREGAGVTADLPVPSPRPRDRGDPDLARMRADLLRRLGMAGPALSPSPDDRP